MSFRDAEKLKLESGLVSLGNGFTDNLPEQDAALATTIRNAMSRLSSEVQRTINHYRAQYKGTAPSKAYICGGGAKLPYAVEFLQSALNIPVEYLNPLHAFSIGSKVDTEALDMDALCLGPVAGAAVTGAKVGAFSIDLVPTSVGKDRAELQMLPKIITGGIVAVLGACGFIFLTNSELKKAEQELQTATKQVKELETHSSAVAKAETNYNEKFAEFESLATLYTQRTAYTDIIRGIAEVGTSYKFWFSQFEPVSTQDPILDQTIESSGRHTRLFAPSAANGVPSLGQLNPAEQNINAIYIKGYCLASEENALRSAYENIAKLKFFDSEVANKDRHVQIINNDNSANASLDYLKTFHMILPLSEEYQLSIPEYRKNDE